MKFTSTSFLILFAASTIWAQPKQNSPYSRYAIGDMLSQYFASQAGMGGQTAASHDAFHLNLVNPASYAYLRTTTLETGIYAKNSLYESATTKQTNWSGNLAYLALGFTLKSPINEVLDKVQSPWRFGMGFSLTPYSLVGYKVETRDTLPDLGDVINAFEGNGGTYRLNWTNAMQYKRTSLGLSLGWTFGKATYENTTFFIDSLPTFQNNFRDDLSVKGFTWNLGLQHDFVLRYAENDKNTPTRWITLGITGEGNHDLKLSADQIYLRSRGKLTNGQYSNPDTIRYISRDNQTLTLPAAFGLGVQFVKANKLKLGAQYNFENWASYRNDARPETLRNTSSFSVGMEYIPDFASYNNYGKRIRLRLGAYYRQDARVINDKNLDDLGFSFGFGLPVVLPRQQTSFINTAFELGKLGKDSPISETYFRITLGFTLNDNTWFYKRRFE